MDYNREKNYDGLKPYHILALLGYAKFQNGITHNTIKQYK